MRKMVGWISSHPWLALSFLVLTFFLLLNVLTYRHAHTMTHFVTGPGSSTCHPEALSPLGKLQLAVCGLAMHRPCEESRPDALGLDYQVHTFMGNAGKLEAWFLPHEQSRGLVLLFHGYSTCKAHLLPEARVFHDLGYACLLVDFRGSGGSEGKETTIGYYEAEDVARAVVHARACVPEQRLILYGQSMGAAAILRALSQLGVRADAAVIECPFDRLLTTVKARFGIVGAPCFPAAQLLVFWGGLQHGFNGFRHNPVEYARKVTCPVLLLHGLEDQRVTRGQIEAIFKNLAGEKQVHFFAGLGHESYVAKKAEEWKQCVDWFLQGREVVKLR